jgi:NAD+ diphosphatase
VKYDNPLPTTIGLVFMAGKVLLLRRSRPPGEGKWDTVGGFLAGGETAEESLIREAREEIGCVVVNLRALGTYSSVYGDTGLKTIGVAFACELESNAMIRLSDENSEYDWFGPAEVPEIALRDVELAVGDWARLNLPT